MREVDARGLSCPEPIMITDEAVKSGDMPVKVLVSEHHQMINVEKYAASKGKSYKSEKVEDGYVITIE